MSHSTRSEWIEISNDTIGFPINARLTPHGVSGLKYPIGRKHRLHAKSHSTRSEWIEILMLLIL